MRKRMKGSYRPNPFSGDSPFSDNNMSSRPQRRKARRQATFQNFTPAENRGDDGKDGRVYYYVHVKPRHSGEMRIFDGPHLTEEEAYEYAYKNMSDKRFNIVQSPYRDPSRATQALKHNILTNEGNTKLDDAIKRVKHNVKGR